MNTYNLKKKRDIFLWYLNFNTVNVVKEKNPIRVTCELKEMMGPNDVLEQLG